MQQALAGPSRPVPHRDALETSFGTSLVHVRAHDDAPAQRATHALGTRAFARGHDIALRPGAPPEVVGHEVAHVLQQTGAPRGRGGDAESEAHAAGRQVARGEPVTTPLSPAPVGVAGFDMGGALSSVGSAVGDAVSGTASAIGDAAESIGEAYDSASDSMEQALWETAPGYAQFRTAQAAWDALGPAGFLDYAMSWARGDLVTFILHNPYTPILEELLARMATSELASLVQQVWGGVTGAAAQAGEVISGAAGALDAAYGRYLMLGLAATDRLIDVFTYMVGVALGTAWEIATEFLPEPLLMHVLRRVEHLSWYMFTVLWPADTGSRATVSTALGVQVPFKGLIIRGGEDSDVTVSFQHIGGGEAPKLRLGAKAEQAGTVGAGVGITSVISATAFGGPDLATSLSGTLDLADLDGAFWSAELLSTLRSGKHTDVVEAIAGATNDLVAATVWRATYGASVVTGAEVGAGLGPIGGWVQALMDQGIVADVQKPSRSGYGFLRAKVLWGRDLSIGAALGPVADAGELGSALSSVATSLLDLRGEAGLDEEINAEVSFHLPSQLDMKYGALPTFEYVDFTHELGGSIAAGSESLAASSAQTLRFTRQSLDDTWQGLDSSVEPSELVTRMPFSSLRFSGNLTFESLLLGLAGLAAEPEVESLLSAGAIAGSLTVQLDITKQAIVDLLTNLSTHAQEVASAALHLDGPGVISALGDALGDVGDFLYQAIEYVDVEIGNKVGAGAGVDIGGNSIAGSASVSRFFAKRYDRSQLSTIATDDHALSGLVQRALSLT